MISCAVQSWVQWETTLFTKPPSVTKFFFKRTLYFLMGVFSVSEKGKCRRTYSSLFPLSLYGRSLAVTHLVTPEVLGRLADDEVKAGDCGVAGISSC